MKPEYKVIAIKETQYFDIEQEDREFIKDIFGVYFYDATERTYCCEATPSRFLEGLYHAVELEDKTPDDIREKIYDSYGVEGPESIYMHCGYVDKIKAADTYTPDDDETMDDVREYWQGNHPF